MITLTPQQAAAYLVGQTGLRAVVDEPGDAGVRSLIRRLRCIQLDPIDRIGTNADLVAAARVDGIARGQVYDALLPGHAFEHFAKERCLIHAAAFPCYRDHARQAPWWRLTERLKRLDEALIDAVLEELTARGPATADELQDRGRVVPLDWSGWVGTSKATRMALEVLWTRCRATVHRRTSAGKQYAVPPVSLPEVHDAEPPEDPVAALLLDRVEAAGLLTRASGPHWGALASARTDFADRLVADGTLVEVVVAGSRRRYLAPPDILDRTFPDDDGRMRILGPLDPVLWDRTLVRHAFGFDYVWEVYKPADKRRYGWYVCPLLHEGRLVGRIEAHVEEGELVVDHVWEEPGGLDRAALRAALDRHQAFLAGERSGVR